MRRRELRGVVTDLQAALFAQATCAVALADFVMPLDATEQWSPPQIDAYDHLRGDYIRAAGEVSKMRALAAREPARA